MSPVPTESILMEAAQMQAVREVLVDIGAGLIPEVLALNKVETEAKVGGRDLAITGMIAAGVCAVFTVLWMLVLMRVVE